MLAGEIKPKRRYMKNLMLYFKLAKGQCLVCIFFQNAKQLTFLSGAQTPGKARAMAQDRAACAVGGLDGMGRLRRPQANS